MVSVKQFMRNKIIEEILIVGINRWVIELLESENRLHMIFSGEIEEALFFGKDVERPIGIIRDRLSAFLTGNRLGDIRLIRFTTLRKMQIAADTNDAKEFLQTLLSGFHSEKSDQYYSRNSRHAAIVKIIFDDSVHSDDSFLELELMREDANKIAKIDPSNTTKRLFQFWLDNFREEDFDEEWFKSKCTELGFDISDILNGYTNKAINVERAASGNSQLVLVF
ncbi:MAG: hypothetical protein Q8R86_04565 [Sulfuricurvum sp.]|nr:hypothetical protein [Sulfuricurvum sp.]